jgi:hypothetical protein
LVSRKAAKAQRKTTKGTLHAGFRLLVFEKENQEKSLRLCAFAREKKDAVFHHGKANFTPNRHHPRNISE